MAKKSAKTDEEGGEAAAGGGSKKKLFIIIGAVLLLGAGGGGYFYMKSKSKAAAEAQAAGPKKQVAFVELKEMNVNLASAPGSDRQSFLKMKIALEVAEQKLVTEIQPLVPRIEDTFQVFMRELRANEIEGSAAVYRLKEELLKRVNVAVYPAKVDAVLFKELLIQ
jgi:flagellar protein FliL